MKHYFGKISGGHIRITFISALMISIVLHMMVLIVYGFNHKPKIVEVPFKTLHIKLGHSPALRMAAPAPAPAPIAAPITEAPAPQTPPAPTPRPPVPMNQPEPPAPAPAPEPIAKPTIQPLAERYPGKAMIEVQEDKAEPAPEPQPEPAPAEEASDEIVPEPLEQATPAETAPVEGAPVEGAPAEAAPVDATANETTSTTAAELPHTLPESLPQTLPESLPEGTPSTGEADGDGSPLGNSTDENASPEAASYEQMLSLWLDKHKKYPQAARKAEMEGEGMVRLVIDRLGNIRYYELVQSTGHDMLDDAIENMVKSSNPVPPLPEGAYGNEPQVEFLIPMDFRLN